MKKILLFITLILTGCVLHLPIPQPAPIPCEVKVNGECREMTPAERTGPVVRGHGDNHKEIQ